MIQDPASLKNLRDIVEPAPVSWWPPAIGWWILLIVVISIALLASARWWISWRRNAYRRAALAELASAKSNAAVAAILKRTAIVAFGRADTASLSGTAWVDWLKKTSSINMPPSVSKALSRGIFETDEAASSEVNDFAVAWIRKHHTE